MTSQTSDAPNALDPTSVSASALPVSGFIMFLSYLSRVVPAVGQLDRSFGALNQSSAQPRDKTDSPSEVVRCYATQTEDLSHASSFIHGIRDHGLGRCR